MFRKLLALLLLLAPAIAHADWYEASTPHFVVYADRDPARLEEFATQLERFDAGLRKLQGVGVPELGPANRLTVFVVDDVAAVRGLTRVRGAAGFYIPRAGRTLAVVPESSGEGLALDLQPMQILLHEYAHHFMWSAFPNAVYPPWLVEGFAEFNATAKFGKDGSVTFGEAPLYRGVGLMRGNALPVEKLLSADVRKLDREQTAALYGRGWLLTHYLRIGAPQRAPQFRDYIKAINAGKPLAEAATAFGDLRQLDRELERYKMGRFLVSTQRDLVIGPVTLRKLTPGEAATMDVRIRSRVGVSDSAAANLYADARRAAAPYPDDPEAQVTLAGAALDAGDPAGAEAAADRAIAADPMRVRALVYKAMAEMLAAKKTGDMRAETWTAIRKPIVAANRLDTEDPLVLITYYRSFVEAGQKPTQAAMQGLEHAFDLAPQDSGLRFNTAAMYLRTGRAVEARAVLAPLAFQPHGRALAIRAAAILTRLDAGDIAGAVAELDGEARKPADGGEDDD